MGEENKLKSTYSSNKYKFKIVSDLKGQDGSKIGLNYRFRVKFRVWVNWLRFGVPDEA